MIADDAEDIAAAAISAIQDVRHEARQHGDTVKEARQIAAIGVEALEKILGIDPIGYTVKIEYGTLYSGGSILIRPDSMEAVYPLAAWIQNERLNGGRVLRRVVHVVEDWSQVEG